MAADVRGIRKYSNRRLYDPDQSRHVTVDEVRDMIVSGEKVRIEDAKSGEDITRSVLLQIIVEREEAGRPLLSAELLEQLIRFYGGAMQEMFGSYLERSVSTFVEHQKDFQQQVLQMVEQNPMAELARRNLDLWKEMGDALGQSWYSALQKDNEDD
jgi:polyhydroxyalkanoate synthesis repressor PhaR